MNNSLTDKEPKYPDDGNLMLPEAEAELQELRKSVEAFRNLLAVINRDGGQKQGRFTSLVQAGKEAQNIVVGYFSDNVRLLEALERIKCGRPGFWQSQVADAALKEI